MRCFNVFVHKHSRVKTAFMMIISHFWHNKHDIHSAGLIVPGVSYLELLFQSHVDIKKKKARIVFYTFYNFYTDVYVYVYIYVAYVCYVLVCHKHNFSPLWNMDLYFHKVGIFLRYSWDEGFTYVLNYTGRCWDVTFYWTSVVAVLHQSALIPLHCRRTNCCLNCILARSILIQ